MPRKDNPILQTRHQLVVVAVANKMPAVIPMVAVVVVVVVVVMVVMAVVVVVMAG